MHIQYVSFCLQGPCAQAGIPFIILRLSPCDSMADDGRVWCGGLRALRRLLLPRAHHPTVGATGSSLQLEECDAER